MDDNKCKNCGQCCYAIIDGKPKKCRYLIKIGNKTRCRIYPNRLGTKICDNWLCGMREQSAYDYEGCQYNDVLGRKKIIKIENNTFMESNTKTPGIPVNNQGGQNESN